MIKVNEKKYVSYTIVGCGWSFTVHNFADAKREWAGMRYGKFYGNMHNGVRDLIDEKFIDYDD